mmetsp:Transcript_44420/g.129154  ORF Transcript_44420/g.129154 Transcript_44420/m.129154 type:complete len:279 (+) Transcript_44420:371-1207(+)
MPAYMRERGDRSSDRRESGATEQRCPHCARPLPELGQSGSGAATPGQPAPGPLPAALARAHGNKGLFNRYHSSSLAVAAPHHEELPTCEPPLGRGCGPAAALGRRGASQRAAEPAQGHRSNRGLAWPRGRGHLRPCFGLALALARGREVPGDDRSRRIASRVLVGDHRVDGGAGVELAIAIVVVVAALPPAAAVRLPAGHIGVVLPRRRHAGGHRDGGEAAVGNRILEGQPVVVSEEQVAHRALGRGPRLAGVRRTVVVVVEIIAAVAIEQGFEVHAG